MEVMEQQVQLVLQDQQVVEEVVQVAQGLLVLLALQVQQEVVLVLLALEAQQEHAY
jgi:hypothetical protein